MIRKLAVCSILLFLVVGCASSPDEIKAAYVSPLQYGDYNCRQISMEMARLTRRVSESHASVKERANGDAVNMGIGLVLFWPSLFFLKGDGPEAQEYAQLLGEKDTLEKVAIQKNCDIKMQFDVASAAKGTDGESDSFGISHSAPPAAPGSEPAKQAKLTSGTGFVVSEDGHILTNHHVVKKCEVIHGSTADMVVETGISVEPRDSARAEPGERTRSGARKLEVVSIDNRNDLALLKGGGAFSAVAAFRSGRGVRTGEDIIVAGFPLHGVLASDINVSRGSVSALAGPGDDLRLFQVSAPVQPGNSGGPVLDFSGNVVGVITGRLDAIKVASATGVMPENVNFAISEGTTRAFMEVNNVPYQMASSSEKIPSADIAMEAKGYTVLIECWK